MGRMPRVRRGHAPTRLDGLLGRRASRSTAEGCAPPQQPTSRNVWQRTKAGGSGGGSSPVRWGECPEPCTNATTLVRNLEVVHTRKFWQIYARVTQRAADAFEQRKTLPTSGVRRVVNSRQSYLYLFTDYLPKNPCCSMGADGAPCGCAGMILPRTSW